MSTHIAAQAAGQCGGAHTCLSVEERISIFTLFIDVTGHGHAHPVKSSCLSHSRHYATKTADQVPLLAVDYGTRGMIFCRIRYGVGGRGCSGISVWWSVGTRGEHAHMA